ncbi:MAG TPA: ABC transporter permease, partial [Bauldia sp.]|nr:ABC transporter permease [Bauldia sp.]
GIEGIMLLGAMVGFATAYHTGSLWLGIPAAIAVGALAGLVMSFLAVVLGVSQHVSGIGMTLLATGLAFYFYRLIFGQPGVPPIIEAFRPLPIPVLADIPVLGEVFFRQTILTYIAFVAVPAVAFALYRTSWGLNLRTVGENPRAADAAGISVWGVRTQALVIGGGMMGIAGAYLTMAQFNAFTFGVVSGRGWVAIALVVFGQWNPWRCAAGAFLFAALEALQLRLQATNILHVPYPVLLMMPFVLTIVAMALVSRNARAPAALLVPFRKEER